MKYFYFNLIAFLITMLALYVEAGGSKMSQPGWSPKKHQYQELTKGYRKYLPTKVSIDIFYISRLVIFFHLMSFLRFILKALVSRNMSSSLQSFMAKLKSKKKANIRDAMLMIGSFILLILILCFNQAL